MCLRVKKRCGVRVARRDLKCWKVVYTTFYGKDMWMAPIRGTVHSYDKCLSIDGSLEVIRYFDSDSKMNVRHIEKGFHGFRDRETAMVYAGDSIKQRIVVECTIPKGAEYCLGERRDIVANQMIVHRTK